MNDTQCSFVHTSHATQGLLIMQAILIILITYDKDGSISFVMYMYNTMYYIASYLAINNCLAA